LELPSEWVLLELTLSQMAQLSSKFNCLNHCLNRLVALGYHQILMTLLMALKSLHHL